jgi:hypothetical protein
MTKDETMSFASFGGGSGRVRSLLFSGVLAGLAAVSATLAGACFEAGSSTDSAVGGGHDDAGGPPPSMDAGDGGDATRSTTTSPGDAEGVEDSGAPVLVPEAGADAKNNSGGGLGCQLTYAHCDQDGSLCCSGNCDDNGACGGMLAEGETCTTGGAPCVDNLPCTQGFCGTNACVPDGTSCADAGVVCCKDDCNGVTCGGS